MLAWFAASCPPMLLSEAPFPLLAVRPWQVAGVLVAGMLVTVLWLAVGPEPRRRRGYRRAMRQVHEGNWRQPLTWVRQQQDGRVRELWRGRFRSLEAECCRLAAEALLKEKEYEAA